MRDIMSKVTLALVAAGGAAFGAATTAALFPRNKTASSPINVNTPAAPAAPFPTPATSPLAVGRPAGVQEALAAAARPVDPNGLYQYGFPGPVSDLRAAASLTSAYDRRTRNPAWVVEHITPESLKNSNADRKHSVFVEDDGIPEKFRAKLKDYFRSGYDRGHQVPAADAKWSQQAMDDTFALSNMCPQVGEGFNRDYWAHFEDFCRRLTGRYPSVRIVTGPLYLPKKDADGKWRVSYEVIGNPPNVAVPTHFYKVIFAEDGKIGGQVSLGAFVLPNARIANDKPLQDFEVPLEAVERYVICVDGLKIEHELTRFVEHLVLSLQRFFLRLRESRCARKSSVPSSSRITRRGKRLWQTRNHRLERRTFDVSKKLLLLDSCTIILYLFFWGGAQVQHHSSMHISYNWSSLSPSLLLLLWSCMS
jgi:endonuclease G